MIAFQPDSQQPQTQTGEDVYNGLTKGDDKNKHCYLFNVS